MPNQNGHMGAEQHMSHMPHIGMRKIKSVLAVFVAFLLWQPVRLLFPDLEAHPIFIYVYSLIEIRDTSEKTVNFGKARIKATFTALGIGLPLLAAHELWKGYLTEPWMYTAAELATLLFGVLLTLLVAEKVGCNAFCGLAAAIFIILMVSHTNDERFIYSILRAIQTIVGVFIAWLINVRLFPYPRKPVKSSAEKSRKEAPPAEGQALQDAAKNG